jgi:xanthine dehydrogenase YagS FAD-binding subunit
MKEFAYERAADAEAAVAAGGTFIAGGTNLVDLMKLGVAAPERLIDVSRLPGDITESDGVLHIGASVRNADAAAHPLVKQHAPLLAKALKCGASAQLRNMATMGGNLLQRTRCPYFQDVTKPCNKRDTGSGCPAIEGEHRDLAILGHSEHCVATHPSDMAVALVALGARCHVLGPDASRVIAMPGLHRLPGDEPQRDTTLEPGELITQIEIPAVAGRGAYRKVRDRASYAFAIVSVAAQLDVADGVVRDVRIALGGVAHVPWRAETAEAQLRGNRLTPEALAAAADAELSAARPLRDNAFKVKLARNLILQTLTELSE